MAEVYDINVSELRSFCPKLRVGDKVLLTGFIYTARDAAHKRFNALMDEDKPLPVDINEAVIYYAGPTPAPEGKPIGSCGPTTSGRMDKFAPRLLDSG
ncbi:MAG: fumarate hydratase C-terminal domain-containing protein, partial [Oscillospiraceae bacterium]